MKKKVRIAAVVVASPIVALAALVILGPMLLSSDALHRSLEEKLSASLDRSVQIEAVQFRLFPQPKLEVDRLSLGPTFSGDLSRVAIASLTVDAAWLPLLDRRIEAKRIHLERPEIEIRESPNTSLNESRDLRAATKPSDAVPPASDPSATPIVFDLKIDALTIEDGTVRMLDIDGHPTLTLEGWDEQLSILITKEQEFQLSGETNIDSWRSVLETGTLGDGLPLTWTKTLRYRGDSDRLEIIESDFQVGGLPISIEGEVLQAMSISPALDVAFRGGPASIDGVFGLVPSELSPALAELESSGTVSLEGYVRGPVASDESVDYQLKLSLENGTLQHPSLAAQSIQDILLAATWGPGSLVIEHFSAKSGENSIEGKGEVLQLDEKAQLDFALQADLDLGWAVGFLPASPERSEAPAPELSGRVKSSLVVRGPVEAPDALEVLGILQLSDVGVEMEGAPLPIENMSGRLELEDRVLTTKDLHFKIGESDFAVTGSLSNYVAFLSGSEELSDVNLVLESKKLNLDELGGTESAASHTADATSKGALAKDASSAGATSMDAPAKSESPWEFLTRVKGPVELKADQVLFRGVQLEETTGLARVDLGAIDLPLLSFQAFGGDVGLSGSIDMQNPERPLFDLRSQASSIEASRLLTECVPIGKLAGMAGTLQGQIDGTAVLRGEMDQDFALQLPSLTSLGNLKLSDGKLAGHPVQNAIATFLELPEVRSLNIADWLQPFNVRDGKLHFEGLSVKAGEYELQADGWQSLGGRIELAASILLPQSASAGLKMRLPQEVVAILFDGSSERVLVPLRVTGLSAEPKVALDRQRLSRQARHVAEERIEAERKALEDRLRREKEEAEQKLKDELERRLREKTGGILDGVLGSSTDPATADSSATESSLESELNGILEGLFKKKKKKP